ncbi:MAG TPA: polysaccharide pyruvyl transferase family protein [Vicinamibacteria bacterium]|nr:polysaccharide pyruvyl transferase family protein [Vicinamibacteria bacterium]
MTKSDVTFWAKKDDLHRLFGANWIGYFVGSYEGYCNYGDILQLVTTLLRAQAVCPGMLAVVLLHYSMRTDHEELTRRNPSLFRDFCPLYFSMPADRVRAGNGDSCEEEFRRVIEAPTGHGQITLYGGGYLNARWAAKKLDLIEALEQWLSAGLPQGADLPKTILVGQQVSQDFLDSSDAKRFGSFLERVSAVGLRDSASLHALETRFGPPIVEKLFLSGDDAVPALIDRCSVVLPERIEPRGVNHRQFTVNVHLNLSDYVTEDPIRHLAAAATLLQQIERLSVGDIRVNLLAAYHGSHISESPYLDRFRAELGWAESRFSLVNCLDDWTAGFEILRAADLSIVSSYHVAMTSLMLSIPTLMLQSNAYYEQKALGLREVFQLPATFVVDVLESSHETLQQTATRVLADASRGSDLRQTGAHGTAVYAALGARTTSLLARFWWEGYTGYLSSWNKSQALKLAEAFQQLSDLKQDHNRLLNATSRLQRHSGPANDFAYGTLISRVRQAVEMTLPTGVTVLVVSRGDEKLLRLGERQSAHFPQTQAGIYAGYHPRDSESAIQHLDDLREAGAEYLLIPGTAFWWLEYYGEFRAHLHAKYFEIFRQEDSCVIFALNPSARTGSIARRIKQLEDQLDELRAVAPALLSDAT